jgi:hypothetical protein
VPDARCECGTRRAPGQPRLTRAITADGTQMTWNGGNLKQNVLKYYVKAVTSKRRRDPRSMQWGITRVIVSREPLKLSHISYTYVPHKRHLSNLSANLATRHLSTLSRDRPYCQPWPTWCLVSSALAPGTGSKLTRQRTGHIKYCI